MILSIIIPLILTVCAYLSLESNGAIVLLFIAQLCLVLSAIKEKNVTGTGAFLFMSFLFFGVRPIYVWTEQDHILFDKLFLVTTETKVLNEAMMWAVLGMITFKVGSMLTKRLHRDKWSERFRISRIESRKLALVGMPMISMLLIYQLLTLVVMLAIANLGKTLYESAAGAYIYDFPVLMQAGHIFTLLIVLERWYKTRDQTSLIVLIAAGLIFCVFTYQMRNISNFRGFYLTGLMAAGIAALARLRRNVNALWLILPILLLLPAFRMLGEARYAKSDELTEVLSEKSTENESLTQQYWDFYNGTGDMNIFDTFVAAQLSQPQSHPYILSWLYVPVHLVPRAIWESKPKKGTLQDMDFTHGAPYSPGIAGFFLLDGGIAWMLLCMAVLGYLLAYIDWYILTMPRSYLRFAIYGIAVVNALGLSRYFLWQYFYSFLYALVPCLILTYLVKKSTKEPMTPKRK